MQRRVNIGAQDAYTVNHLFGEHATMFHSALTRLIIQIAGNNDQFMAAFAQILRQLKVTSMPRLIGRNKGLIEQQDFH